jgi:hypothetical protein
MSAPPRASVEQIREALSASRGNVSAAADRLGIARNNLYKRALNNGIDPGSYRPRRLVEQPAAPRGAVRSMRVPITLYDQLREAKFDLQAKLRRDLDEADVLAAFMADGFGAWLARRLGQE